MRWSLHDDGSFGLDAGDFALSDAYPAQGGVPLRPTGVSVERDGGGGRIEYRSAEYTLRLVFGTPSPDEAALDATYVAAATPRSLAPLALAVMSGVKRLFRQAQGIGGGTGFVDVPPPDKTVTSHAITALVGPLGAEGGDGGGAAIIITTPDHGRFEHLCTVGALPGDGYRPRLTAGFSTEGVPLPTGELALPTLRITRVPRLDAGLRDAAQVIAHAMGARAARPASYHWCSWYYLYHNLDMPLLREYLAGFKALQPAMRVDYFQIDAGYFPSAGDWLLPTPRFPEGLGPAFRAIRGAGYKPGVWIGPFMVGNRSRLFDEHPDWLLRDRAGELVTPWRHYGEPKVWGYPDEESYVLDTSHPAAMDYLHEVFVRLRELGAEMFKTDFLYWGLQDSAKVRRHAPGKTSVEYMRDALTTIRDAIGRDAFWLGCIAPYMPCVGFMDAMRIGGDVGPSWRGAFGPQNMLGETAHSQHFNHVFWQNDPDAIMLRDFHLELTTPEVRSLALWQAAMGGSVNTSDPLHRIAPERLRLWRGIEPPERPALARLPLLGREGRPLVAVRDFAPGVAAVLIFNASDAPEHRPLTLRELGLPPQAAAAECEEQAVRPLGTVSALPTELAPHASRLYYVGNGPLPTEAPARFFTSGR